MDERLKDMKILKVVLQPLVENSIKHGFQDNDRDYCITLMANQTGDRKTHLIVMDNGSGMTEDRLKTLKEEIRNICENPEVKLTGTKHIGIKNVVQRMALEYGGNFQIYIDSKEGFGVRIEMMLQGGE